MAEEEKVSPIYLWVGLGLIALILALAWFVVGGGNSTLESGTEPSESVLEPLEPVVPDVTDAEPIEPPSEE